MGFVQEPYTNRTINRFINHQIQRLIKYRNNPGAFWAVSKHLLASPTFQVACFHHVFTNWHRKMPYYKVMIIMKKVIALTEQIIRGQTPPISFKRLFIPKGNGKSRPLEIPAPEWRVVLHSINILMTVFFTPYQSPNQHGFWPGRGTDTAWKQIHTEVLGNANIYEFDLEAFFDRINLTYIDQILESINLHPTMRKIIDTLNRSLPISGGKLPQDWESEQEHLEDVIYYYTKFRISLNNTLSIWLARLYYEYKLIDNPQLCEFEYLRGVPQGSPLSPLLASIALHPTLLKAPSIVQYADDGIIYDTTNPSQYLTFPPQKWDQSKCREN